MGTIKTLLTVMFCISLVIGCGGKIPNGGGSGSQPPNGNGSVTISPVYELQLQYTPVNTKHTGSQAEKWMRDCSATTY